MVRISVDSKNIKSAAYDQENLTAEIEFQNGGIYQYYPFYENQWEEFSEAESKGAWFNKNVKPRKSIACKKIK